MRILMGIHRLWNGGGTETHTITLANQLRKSGHQVHIFTSGGPWVNRARKLGIPVHVNSTSTQTRRDAELKRLLSRYAFQILHAHDAASLFAFTRITAPMKKHPKIIFTVHGHYIPASTIVRANQRASAIIAVSPNVRHAIGKSITTNRVHTVSNGIRADIFRAMSDRSLRRRYGIPHTAFVVGYSSRFTFDKLEIGKRVVQTLRQYASVHPNVHILVAGRGAKKVIQSSRHVHVLGHVDQMPAFFNNCDVVIATGRTAVEALFCEVPVLALGNKGLLDRVTVGNIQQMIQTNFGDHGPSRKWTNAALKSALSNIQFKSERYRAQAKSIRQNLRNRLSASRVAQRTLYIYRNV